MSETAEEPKISKSLRAQIQRNREKAIILRRNKLVPHSSKNAETLVDTTIKIGTTKYKDTGGGFLLEERDEIEELKRCFAEDEAGLYIEDRPFCLKCNKPISTSWLYDNFSFECCDECKDTEEEHKLLPKSEAMNTYLLKPVDLDKREPLLRFITRKNPHNANWGDMKLYLKPQVEKRAFEIWGSLEDIEKEKEAREEKKAVLKAKKYTKQMKELRMNMRSSLYDRTQNTVAHVHNFGEDTYNSDDDTYTHSCLSCPYTETYEKM